MKYCFVTPTEYLPCDNIYGIIIQADEFSYYSIIVYYKNMHGNEKEFSYNRRFESITDAQQFIYNIYDNQ